MGWRVASTFITTAAVAGTVVLWWRHGRLRRDGFFLWYLSASTVYLHVGPCLSLWQGTLPSARPHAEYYVLVQVLCIALFQVPLALVYFFRRTDVGNGVSLRVRRGGAELLAAFSVLLAVAFVVTIVRNDALNIQTSREALVDRLLGLPLLDYAVMRSYQEAGLFVIGVLLAASRLTESRRLRYQLTAACGLNVIVYGIFAAVNSRLQLVLLAVVLLGVGATVRAPERENARRRHIGAVAVFAGVCVALSAVALVRNDSADGRSPAVGLRVIDESGADRLNGIDLIAQMYPVLQHEPPAFGAAWTGASWQIRRFFDRDGFDRYRRTYATTAKSYLMRRYLNNDAQDYYSSSLTDLFGNFHFVGFLLGAVLFGAAWRWASGALAAPRSTAAFIVALFLAIRLLSFESETMLLVFGWIQLLPVLLVVVLIRPFRLVTSVERHTIAAEL